MQSNGVAETMDGLQAGGAPAGPGVGTVPLTAFDNRLRSNLRSLALAMRRGRAAAYRRPLRLGGARPHFAFELGGQRFVYAYIYKNACSAFKNLIVETSPHRSEIVEREDKIHFMLRHHLVRTLNDVSRDDIKLFVHRDPISRFASAFTNKFVVQDGYRDIFANVHWLTGRDPMTLSASEVVFDVLSVYLSTGIGAERTILDHHFTAQYDCLGGLRYDAAISMRDLQASMAQLVGEETATRFFGKRVNHTKASKYAEDVCDVPAIELRERYLAHNELPDDASLVSDAMRARLATLYRQDIAYFSDLR